MLAEKIGDPRNVTESELRKEYETALIRIVERKGVDTAAAVSEVEEERLEALVSGDSPELTIDEAASLFALSEEYPDADDIVFEVRDHLMLQMSGAIMDVDSLAADLDGDLETKEIQQKIEGRKPMTLAEYARIHCHIASENPY